MKRFGLVLALIISILVFRSSFAETVSGENGGRLRLRDQKTVFSPGMFVAPNWKYYESQGGYATDADGSYHFTLGPKKELCGTARFSREGDDVRAEYLFRADQEVKLHTLCLTLSLPVENFGGGTVVTDGTSRDLPAKYGNTHLFSSKVSSFSVRNNKGDSTLTVRFSEPTGMMVQDNREWNSADFSVRIYLTQDATVCKGEEYKLAFTVSVPSLDHFAISKPVVLRRGKEWIPVTVFPDIEQGSALDFSRISGIDAPAGKYGYVVAKGENFEFEKLPGVPQRFYGVNICFSANLIERDLAKKFAKRLARIGYNALRIHHYDGALTDNGKTDGTTLNLQAMDRLDGILAACIEEGIYITTDLFVSRVVPYRSIGMDKDGNVAMDEYKALVLVHEGAFQNLLTFSRQLLSHRNPYTGRTYAEEPALAWLALVNEGNPGNFGHYLRLPEWESAWKKWLAERKSKDPAFRDVPETIPSNLWNRDTQSGAYTIFLQEIETKFATRMREFLRNEMKCKALMTNMSSWMNPVAYQLPRSLCYDYVDDHFYVDHPNFLETSWRLPSRCANRNPIEGDKMGAQEVVFRRLLDKPFTITEYNYSGPGRFRGVGGIALGTIASLQNWGGVWRFAWSHSESSIRNPEKATMGYFDMAGDPLSLAAERASICLFLRQDLPQLKRTYAITLPEKKLTDDFSFSPLNKTEWPWISWFAKFGTIVSDREYPGAVWSDAFPDAYRRSSVEVRQRLGISNDAAQTAGDGAVQIDAKRGTFLLTTSRTCGGFSENGVIRAGALTADLGETAATVWVSSLDKTAISDSKRLLLTHLTDVQNEGIKYADSERTILLAWGGTPHLMKAGKVAVRLSLSRPESYRVYALTTGGTRRSSLPVTVSNGVLSFTADVAADPQNATFLYEIVAE